MRCWKVGHKEDSHWVFFHFQQSRDELVWVTVIGKATIFLTLCLHSAVDELLWQRSNKPIRKPSENEERRVGVLGKGSRKESIHFYWEGIYRGGATCREVWRSVMAAHQLLYNTRH